VRLRPNRRWYALCATSAADEGNTGTACLSKRHGPSTIVWLEELLSYEKFPPLQTPESYNLSQVIDEVKKANLKTPSE
jgi:hypothetical protein